MGSVLREFSVRIGEAGSRFGGFCNPPSSLWLTLSFFNVDFSTI
jgi:hypothetical protein